MTTRIALRWLACLCVLPWLASCGLTHTVVVPRPQLIDRPVVSYRPLPAALTDELAGPPTPAAGCTDARGQSAVCVLPALATIPLWRGVVERCNADRHTAATLGAPAVSASTGAP